MAKRKAGEALKWSAIIIFGLIFVLGIPGTIWVWHRANVPFKGLAARHPWEVKYGKINGSPAKSFYVHARIENTTGRAIAFEEYGKAVLKPNPTSIELLRDPQLVNPLKDEVRRLASGGDATTITANARKSEPAYFVIPGPVVPRSDSQRWLSGALILYYDVLVYAKLSNGMRFAFEDCGIVRTIPVIEVIPGAGSKQLPRQQSDMSCN